MFSLLYVLPQVYPQVFTIINGQYPLIFSLLYVLPQVYPQVFTIINGQYPLSATTSNTSENNVISIAQRNITLAKKCL